MKLEVVMPKMGESLQEGTITKWLKNVGDKIERDEMILEISTDKVDTEVPAPNEGTLSEILAQEGDTVEVGSVIAYIETDASAAAAAPKEEVKETAPVQEEAAPAPAASGGNLVDLIMPKMGESLQEGTITKWLKNIGDKVERDEMVLEISTDKVDTEVPSPVEGVLAEILVQEGETVEVGSVIGKMSSGDAPVKAAAPAATKQESKPAAAQSAPTQTSSAQVTAPASGGTYKIPTRDGEDFFSPLVRKIAEENKVSLEELKQIQGSGVGGRVSKADLMSYIGNRGAAPAQAPAAQPQAQQTSTPAQPKAAPAPAPVAHGDDVEVIPMDRVRQLIADHMVYSKQTSPHVTSVAEADVTNIVNFRNKFKDEFMKREGFKLTFTPFFAQAAIEGLKKFPMVNVSIDGKNILRHKRINLGVATALDDGNLIVPVIKSAEALNITGLARSVNDLAGRARSKRLDPNDIQGGTFTITNVGTFGTLFGTPIINQPQVGIFGIGAIQKRPVVKQVDGMDVIVPRDMVYVSLTYDHRVVDGMLAGQTLKAIVDALENMNEKTISI